MDINFVKSAAMNTLIGIMVLGVFSLIPFYYTTRNTLAQYSNDFEKLSNEVKELSDTIRDNEQAPIMIQGEIKAMNKDISHIQLSQERHEKQLDKIYDILWEWKQQNGN